MADGDASRREAMNSELVSLFLSRKRVEDTLRAVPRRVKKPESPHIAMRYTIEIVKKLQSDLWAVDRVKALEAVLRGAVRTMPNDCIDSQQKVAVTFRELACGMYILDGMRPQAPPNYRHFHTYLIHSVFVFEHLLAEPFASLREVARETVRGHLVDALLNLESEFDAKQLSSELAPDDSRLPPSVSTSGNVRSGAVPDAPSADQSQVPAPAKSVETTEDGSNSIHEHRGQHRQPEPRAHSEGRTAALEHLEAVVGNRCADEWQILRLASGGPMSVKWTRITDTNIANSSATIFDDSGTPIVDLYSDKPRDLAKQFRPLKQQCLVILGDAGAGKTVLAHVLQKELLSSQSWYVPIVLTLSSWNIEKHDSLLKWLIFRLEADFPDVLESGERGTSRIELLVQQNHILPILDGLDEVAPTVRERTWRLINGYLVRPDAVAVVTCRTDTYVDIVTRFGKLKDAAVYKGQPLSRSDIIKHLKSAIDDSDLDSRWSIVFRVLEDAAEDDPLLAVCSHPLGLWLLRTVYVDGCEEHPESAPDPIRLLDPALSNETALKQHLFADLIPTLIERRTAGSDGNDRPRRTWNAIDTERWLSYIAHKHRETTDIHWWALYFPPVTAPEKSADPQPVTSQETIATDSFISKCRSSLKRAEAAWSEQNRQLRQAGGLRSCVGLILGFLGIAVPIAAEIMVMPLLFLVMLPVAAVAITWMIVVRIVRFPIFVVGRVLLGDEPGRFTRNRASPNEFIKASFRRCRKSEHFDSGHLEAGFLGLLFGIFMWHTHFYRYPVWGFAMSNRLARIVTLGVLGLVAGWAGPRLYAIVHGLYDWIFLKHDDSEFGKTCPVCIAADEKRSRWRTPESTFLESRTRIRWLFLIGSIAFFLLGLACWICLLILAWRSPRGVNVWHAVVVLLVVIAASALLGLTGAVWREPAWFSYILISKWLALRGKLPWRTMAFLEDAERLGLLRRSGAVYQFRHAELQQYLEKRDT